jgi:hypothetical protein
VSQEGNDHDQRPKARNTEAGDGRDCQFTLLRFDEINSHHEQSERSVLTTWPNVSVSLSRNTA